MSQRLLDATIAWLLM